MLKYFIILFILSLNSYSFVFPKTMVSNRSIKPFQVSNTSGVNTTTDNPYVVTVSMNKLFFVANNSSGVAKLFYYDGTSVSQVPNTSGSATITDNPMGTNFYYYMEYNGKLYFQAYNSSSKTKLFSFDGTTLTQISNTSGSASSNDNPMYMTVYNSKLYFQSLDSSGYTKLFYYDGISVNQAPVLNASGNDLSTSYQTTGSPYNWQYTNYGFAIMSGKLLLSMYNSSGKEKLYSFDGTTYTALCGTNGTSGSVSTNDSPRLGYVWGTKFVYTSMISTGYLKPFTYDSINGCVNIANNYASGNDQAVGFYEFKSKLYYRSVNSSNFVKLYSYDGTNSPSQVFNFYTTGSDTPEWFYKITNNGNDYLCMTITNSSGVLKNMCYDGSSYIFMDTRNNSTLTSGGSYGWSDGVDYYFGGVNPSGYTRNYVTNGVSFKQIDDEADLGTYNTANPGYKFLKFNGLICYSTKYKGSSTSYKLFCGRP